jgi:hypothetical protein
VREWIKESADLEQGREIMASLSALPTGDAWVWAPELGVLHRGHFPLASTFDSGSIQANADSAPQLASIDLEAVTERLQAVAADVVANDPKALRAEIARLRAEVAKAQKLQEAPDPKAVERLVADAYTRGIEEGERRGNVAGQALALTRVRNALDAVKVDQAAAMSISSPSPERPKMNTPSVPRRRPAGKSESRAPILAVQTASDGSVPTGCAKPLGALAAVYPSGLTEAQWATAAGYKRSGGTWGTYKSRLRGAGLIEQREGRWFSTEAGAAAAGDVELPPPAGPDLVRWWAAKLPGTSKVAEALIEAWPADLDRDELAARIGMSPSGGSFGTYLSRLAGPGLIERDGRTIRLSTEAMGEN